MACEFLLMATALLLKSSSAPAHLSETTTRGGQRTTGEHFLSCRTVINQTRRVPGIASL